MSTDRRRQRLNSLLREVISDVITKEVKNPHKSAIVSVTEVDITKDLRQAKVFVSVLAEDKAREETIKALQSAAGFIAVHASKLVKMRYFPELTFHLDTSVDKQLKVHNILEKIEKERAGRNPSSQ